MQQCKKAQSLHYCRKVREHIGKKCTWFIFSFVFAKFVAVSHWTLSLPRRRIFTQLYLYIHIKVSSCMYVYVCMCLRVYVYVFLPSSRRYVLELTFLQIITHIDLVNAINRSPSHSCYISKVYSSLHFLKCQNGLSKN